MSYRIEKDTIGEIKVESDKYWGAQTERSRKNFKIGPAASMPLEIVHAFAVLKKAAAITNCELGVIEKAGSWYSHNGEKIGQLTSGMYSPSLKANVAVGMIARDFWDYKGAVEINCLDSLKRNGIISAFPLK